MSFYKETKSAIENWKKIGNSIIFLKSIQPFQIYLPPVSNAKNMQTVSFVER